jgi:integrase
MRSKEIIREQQTMPSPAWQAVIPGAKANSCLDVALHFQLEMEPGQVTVKATDALLMRWVKEGANYGPTKNKMIRFWRVLRDAGLNSQCPSFMNETTRYGVPFKKLPIEFKESVVALLAWLVAEWAKDRPDKKHLRHVTASGIQATICMLFGFALVKFPKLTIKTVPELFIELIVEKYVEFAKNERHVEGYYLRKRLQSLCSAVRWHTKKTNADFEWCQKLMHTLPPKPDRDKIDARKKQTRVDHKSLRQIPAEIRATRKRLRAGTVDYALAVRNELLITWLLYLPWRQRNIRMMRIDGFTPNLFYGPLEDVYEIPPWVIEVLKTNKEAEFWQIRFIKDETKMKHGVVAVLPKALIGILEEYRLVRPDLLAARKSGIAPETLFLTATGQKISANGVTDLVQTLTLRHVDKAINPHRFRDMFAYAWLKDNPKDYLTLSKILWHKSVQVTIDTYGAEFDVASGVLATEAWAEKWGK